MSQSFLRAARERASDAVADHGDAASAGESTTHGGGSASMVEKAEVIFRELGANYILPCLDLPSVANVVLCLNKYYKRWAVARIKAMWPVLLPLLRRPFDLRRKDVMSLTYGSFGMIKSKDMAKLCEALTIGALPNLSVFNMEGGNLNDAALCNLAQICASGALARVTQLHLKGNRIGNAGLKSLAEACAASAALPSLETLILDENRLGDEGMIALGAACRAGALPRLTKFHFTANSVGATGVEALAAAC
eukprot:6671218-Prymnesium_polylepis.1